MSQFVGAVDQGTTSTRFMVFDEGGNEVARHQLEHQQILPQPGWVEHDPLEIAARTNTVIAGALRQRRARRRGPRGDRRHQSARDHGRLESEDRSALVQRHRLAGHAHRSDRQRARQRSGRPSDSRAHRPAARHVFLRRRSCSGSSRTSTACARRPRAAKRCSAPSTRGSSGISPAGPTAAPT